MGFSQRTWEKIVGEGETVQHLKLALAKAGGIRAFRVAIHLEAIMLQERFQNKLIFRTRK
jgi:hypothetical protein